MLGAVIRNGSATLVADLPRGTTDLMAKLLSIGVSQTPDNIRISDEDEDQVRVKLYATEPEETHLLSLLTPEKSLSDANMCMLLLQKANQNNLPRLKDSLLGGNYHNLDEFIADAKMLFAGNAAKDIKTIALRKLDEDPNIRAVVSCTHDGEIEMFSLPMSDRQLTVAAIKLEEYNACDCSLKIEALRYQHPWPDVFNDVLQSEGLAALNSFAAAFPYLEDLRKYAAVIEYASVTDSKSLIKLADHIDDFEFFPNCFDVGDVAREWIDGQPYLELSGELEDYFDFDAMGNDLQDEYHGEFVSDGYVFLPDGMDLHDILDDDQDMDFQ